ncbi:hypothetical protein KKF84_18140 [Myxococcota bacterium]|nr:hypothetical protein [Myxococcota bacterium]MBU1537243.1 hypothetical protein [Myxococcota bacterium]
MHNRFELAQIDGAIKITSIAYTIIDGVRDLVEYRCFLSQGVNNEWRNIFTAAWDKATAPTVPCSDYLRRMAVPKVSVGTVFTPAVITFVCERGTFQETATLVRETTEQATKSYLTQLGIHTPAVHPQELTIQEDISVFMDSMAGGDERFPSLTPGEMEVMRDEMDQAENVEEHQEDTTP